MMRAARLLALIITQLMREIFNELADHVQHVGVAVGALRVRAFVLLLLCHLLYELLLGLVCASITGTQAGGRRTNLRGLLTLLLLMLRIIMHDLGHLLNVDMTG